MREREFETGMDENMKATAVGAAHEALNSLDRRNDHHASQMEELRHKRLQAELDSIEVKNKLRAIELADKEQSLTERKNREFTIHMANLQALNLGESLKTTLADAIGEIVSKQS